MHINTLNQCSVKLVFDSEQVMVYCRWKISHLLNYSYQDPIIHIAPLCNSETIHIGFQVYNEIFPIQIISFFRHSAESLRKKCMLVMCIKCHFLVIVTLHCGILALVWLFGPANVTFMNLPLWLFVPEAVPCQSHTPHEIKKIYRKR